MGDETPEKERLAALEKQMAASNTAIAELTGLVNQLLLKLFEPPLLNDDGDNKTVLPSVEDLWFDREDPLVEDCILERKVTTTRKGERTAFLIGRAGQVPSKAKWFSEEKGTLEFPNLQFQLKREFKFLKGGAMIHVYPLAFRN